jgi:hypothetical protein
LAGTFSPSRRQIRSTHLSLAIANKIIRRAGGDFNMSPPFRPRRKGMWRTYERRIDQAIDAEVRCQEVFELEVKKFMDRADRRSGIAA